MKFSFYLLFAHIDIMDSHTKTPINITIGNNEDLNGRSNPYVDFKEYVIVNNIELQKELKNSLVTIKDLEATVAEKDAEEDKYDNRVRYMKGLIQNLNELKTEYSYLEDKEKEINKLVNKYVVRFQHNHTQNYNYCAIIIMMIIIAEYNTYLIKNNIMTIIVRFIVGFVLGRLCHKLFQNYNTMKKNERDLKTSISQIDSQIAEKRKEIKKVEESTLTLDNWICEI